MDTGMDLRPALIYQRTTSGESSGTLERMWTPQLHHNEHTSWTHRKGIRSKKGTMIFRHTEAK